MKRRILTAVICGFLLVPIPERAIGQAAAPPSDSWPGTARRARSAHPDGLPEPPVLEATYTIVLPYMGKTNVSFHEEDEKLTMRTRAKDMDYSRTVAYTSVSYVELELDSFETGAKKRTLHVDAADGVLTATFPSEADAAAAAEYIGKKASLDLIGGAWRVRRKFQCPESEGVSCASFEEMLAHDDPGVVDYAYERSDTTRTFACFGETGNSFFLFGYTQPKYVKSGHFRKETFEDGQSTQFAVGRITWISDEFGDIKSLAQGKSGAKPNSLGTIDNASLAYHENFTNRMGTMTNYSLDVRWSTSRFLERYEGKDDKGKPFFNEVLGSCVKLH